MAGVAAGVDLPAAFGGDERIRSLQKFLDAAKSLGAAVHIISHNDKSDILQVRKGGRGNRKDWLPRHYQAVLLTAMRYQVCKTCYAGNFIYATGRKVFLKVLA